MNIDFPFERFRDQVEQNIKRRMRDDSLSIINIEKGNEKESRTQLREIYDDISDRYYPLYTNFIYINTVEPDDVSFDDVLEYISWANEIKKPNDNIIVLSLIPAKVAVEAIKKLTVDYYKGIDTYFFTYADDDTQIRRQALVSAVSGVIVLSSLRDHHKQHMMRKINAAGRADQYIAELNPNAIEEFTKTQDALWSTVYCKFYDRKMDYLAWYCYNMCDHIKTLDDAMLTKIFDKIYLDYVANNNHNMSDPRIKVLVQSILMIPTMIAPPEKRRKPVSFTVKSRLEELYGADEAKQMLELSMRTSLAGVTVESIVPSNDILIDKIYEECKNYYVPDLFDRLVGSLAMYIEKLDANLKELTSIQDSALNNPNEPDTEYEVAVKKYVGAYLKRYDLHKQISFWKNLQTCIENKDEAVQRILAYNNESIEKIRAFRNNCKETMPQIEQETSVAFSEYSLAELISLIEGEHMAPNICRDIRATYETCHSNVDQPIYNRIGDRFNINFISNTYDDYEIEFEHGTCVIRGFERNGKYLVFEK
jgi:hypothetical protein